MQDGMMFRKHLLEVLGKLPSILRVAIGNMGDQVDQVVERLDEVGARKRWRLEKELSLGLVLTPLSNKIIFV